MSRNTNIFSDLMDPLGLDLPPLEVPSFEELLQAPSRTSMLRQLARDPVETLPAASTQGIQAFWGSLAATADPSMEPQPLPIHKDLLVAYFICRGLDISAATDMAVKASMNIRMDESAPGALDWNAIMSSDSLIGCDFQESPYALAANLAQWLDQTLLQINPARSSQQEAIPAPSAGSSPWNAPGGPTFSFLCRVIHEVSLKACDVLSMYIYLNRWTSACLTNPGLNTRTLPAYKLILCAAYSTIATQYDEYCEGAVWQTYSGLPPQTFISLVFTWAGDFDYNLGIRIPESIAAFYWLRNILAMDRWQKALAAASASIQSQKTSTPAQPPVTTRAADPGVMTPVTKAVGFPMSNLQLMSPIGSPMETPVSGRSTGESMLISPTIRSPAEFASPATRSPSIPSGGVAYTATPVRYNGPAVSMSGHKRRSSVGDLTQPPVFVGSVRSRSRSFSARSTSSLAPSPPHLYGGREGVVKPRALNFNDMEYSPARRRSVPPLLATREAQLRNAAKPIPRPATHSPRVSSVALFPPITLDGSLSEATDEEFTPRGPGSHIMSQERSPGTLKRSSPDSGLHRVKKARRNVGPSDSDSVNSATNSPALASSPWWEASPGHLCLPSSSFSSSNSGPFSLDLSQWPLDSSGSAPPTPVKFTTQRQ